MANTIVEIFLPSGLTGCLLKLFDQHGDTLQNTGGDTLTERTNKHGSYTATVTEALVGTYDAIATLSDGTTTIAAGEVTMADDTNTYSVVEPGVSAIPTADQNATTLLDKALSGHTTSGTTGGALLAAVTLLGKFTGITFIAKWLGLLGGKTADASTLNEFQATPAGATFDNTTDSGQAIRDRGDASWTSGADLRGPGASNVTLTLTDGADPIGDAEVWISSDLAGNTVVAGTLLTNDAGSVTFKLDVGVTYYRWANKNGVNFTNPQSFVAVAD